jgi:hypothetical protein
MNLCDFIDFLTTRCALKERTNPCSPEQVINIDDVVAASFQNKSMTSDFLNLFQPTSPVDDRIKAATMNSRIDLQYFVGESQRKAGDMDAAAQAAKRVTEFDPLTASAWSSLAMAEEQAGNLTVSIISTCFSTPLDGRGSGSTAAPTRSTCCLSAAHKGGCACHVTMTTTPG